MSYEPTNWKTGDKVTSEKLNKLENGVANGVLYVNVNLTESKNTYIMDKTWQEIHDADICVFKAVEVQESEEGRAEYTVIDYSHRLAQEVGEEVSIYTVYVNMLQMEFITDSPDGYPSVTLN